MGKNPSNIQQAITLGLSGFQIKIPMLGSEWGNEHFYLSPESSGTEGRWRAYPYQIGLINWMTSDDIEVVNIVKSKRVGYTKCLLLANAHYLTEKRRNVVIYQPTDDDANKFSLDEVDTSIRDIPVLGNMLRCPVGAKSKFNTLDKKTFLGATLDIKGGKAARNYRRMTKDVAIYDELSGFDNDIEGEGAPTKLGDGRLDQAPFPKSIRGSTPKTEGTCLISSEVAKSDLIFKRFIKCPHCEHLHPLEFKNLKWENKDPSTAYFACPKNGCVILYRHYAEADKSGRWQAENGFYYNDLDDCFYDLNNKKVDKPRSIGATIWAAYSYLKPWSYIVREWLEASDDAKTGKITKLKSVINLVLGEPFKEKGEKVESEGLIERVENFPEHLPEQVLVITAGADIQGGLNARVEVEFVGWGHGFESWSLGYEVVPGDFERQEVKDQVAEVLSRKFTRQSGLVMGVRAAFIDSGYMAREVYKFCAPRRRRSIYATKGVNTGQLVNAGTWQGDKKDKSRAILRTMNVDDAKETLFKRLRINKYGPGYCHFPASYDDEHFEKLTNEEKREKHRRGQIVGYEWVKIGPNEPLDCRNYATGALEYSNPNFVLAEARIRQRETELQGRSPIDLQDQNKGPKKRNFVTDYK